MTAPENRNPWDDVFADLGLSPETPTGGAEAPAAPVAEQAPARPVEEPAAEAAPPAATEAAPPPPRGRRRRSPAAVKQETPPPVLEEQEPAAVATDPVEAIGSLEESTPEGEAATVETPAGEAGADTSAPRGRSRRRRRGRGSKSGAAASAAPAEGESEPAALTEQPSSVEVQGVEPAPQPAGLAEESDDHSRERRQDRSRGRRPERSEGSRAGGADVQGMEEEEEAPVEIDGEELEPVSGDEEVDDLSNLNVPTWAELIASLYRPER